MMHYPTLASNSSLYNTLPIFDVYIAGEVMSQLLTSGGVAAIAAAAERKSSSVYEVIDKNPTVFTPVITDTKARSRMNVCFRLVKGKDGRDLEKQFFEEAEKKGLLGIKGHRSVGGGRISCYNAVGEEEVAKLVVFMKEFAAKQGHTYLPLN